MILYVLLGILFIFDYFC